MAKKNPPGGGFFCPWPARLVFAEEEAKQVQQAIEDLGIDPEKVDPSTA